MTLKVEIFSSPGCGKCGKTTQVLRNVAAEFGADLVHWREVNVLEELDYAVSLGVVTTPAIAIDGQLCYVGMPSATDLRQRLQAKLKLNP
jgi:glutaredoxin